MKYFYEGKLVRTSTHVYTHAVLDDEGKCVACRNGLEAALKAKEAEKSFFKTIIRDSNEAIKALKAGRKGYFYKMGRSQYFCKFTAENTLERYQTSIANAEAQIARIDTYQVVELEAR